ncbi:MAG: ABC transporter permease [Alphaproteobacteria bacterium]|nr:ABC transporter permease [Alphaproteobacteria bacterium]
MTATTPAAVIDIIEPPKPIGQQIVEFCRRNTTVVFGSILLLSMVIIAIFAPFFAPGDPLALAPARRLRPPSETYWFGTDMFGRDVFTRTIYGTRISLIVGISVSFLSTLIGLVIGMLSGYVRMVDAIVMRIMDGLMAIPGILLAIAMMALTKASVENVVIAITIPEIPRVVRLVRGVVLQIREQPYIEAAQSIGTRFHRILIKHILPNIMAPLIVQATYICAAAVLIEAGLSFLGAGTPPNIPSWGNIMAEGRTFFQIAFWIILFPGLFLSVTVLAINLLGDGLRDALDPRLARRM